MFVGRLKEIKKHGFHSYQIFWQPIAEDEIGGTCSTHARDKNAHKTLVGKPEGKRPLRRPKLTWKDNIKMGIKNNV
jgi:hypothetical protein